MKDNLVLRASNFIVLRPLSEMLGLELSSAIRSAVGTSNPHLPFYSPLPSR